MQGDFGRGDEGVGRILQLGLGTCGGVVEGFGFESSVTRLCSVLGGAIDETML